jgi:hypothetical protein
MEHKSYSFAKKNLVKEELPLRLNNGRTSMYNGATKPFALRLIPELPPSFFTFLL